MIKVGVWFLYTVILIGSSNPNITSTLNPVGTITWTDWPGNFGRINWVLNRMYIVWLNYDDLQKVRSHKEENNREKYVI